MMIPKTTREEDAYYIAWIHDHDEWECVITGNPEADSCHPKSVKTGGSDYRVFPLTHELHMYFDHRERSSGAASQLRRAIKEVDLRAGLVEWYMRFPFLHLEYLRHLTVEARTGKKAANLLKAVILRPTSRDVALSFGNAAYWINNGEVDV